MQTGRRSRKIYNKDIQEARKTRWYV